ncbi:MAG: Uncharacterized protein XD60_0928 [Acetothermia bacterium 64_32]|nr:MAG: Uncharacterized protein XD60_0928 [Acetothermia bacterium 64_32]HAF70937.1 YqeG family HAD IIIA-type phosphatase [Candidatus Acetothermia bacterium]
MRILRPRGFALSVHHIDYEALWGRGIRALIFDLDNTLCLWRAGPPDAGVRGLLEGLIGRGFRVAVVSNGRLSRRPEVVSFFEGIGVPVIWRARKPFPFGFRRVLGLFGVRAGQAAMIGDQVFTDVLGGNLAGLYTILVEPLEPTRESPFTRFNRLLERFIRRRRPAQGS